MVPRLWRVDSRLVVSGGAIEWGLVAALWSFGAGARSPSRRPLRWRRRAAAVGSSRICRSGEVWCPGQRRLCVVSLAGVGVAEASMPGLAFVLQLLLCRGGVSSGSIGKLVRVSRRLDSSGAVPEQGRWFDGGRSGADSSIPRRRLLDPEAGVPLPRVVHRLTSRRSSAGNFCFLKASWRSSIQVWGWLVFLFFAGVAGVSEWWRPACCFSFVAVVLDRFRQCVPVYVVCTFFLLC